MLIVLLAPNFDLLCHVTIEPCDINLSLQIQNSGDCATLINRMDPLYIL